jgi:hypothetical protein
MRYFNLAKVKKALVECKEERITSHLFDFTRYYKHPRNPEKQAHIIESLLELIYEYYNGKDEYDNKVPFYETGYVACILFSYIIDSLNLQKQNMNIIQLSRCDAYTHLIKEIIHVTMIIDHMMQEHNAGINATCLNDIRAHVFTQGQCDCSNMHFHGNIFINYLKYAKDTAADMILSRWSTLI